ncbi:MAG TPA: prolyl oligopeptidase family serine peptidase [Gemmataceae bacterium]|nr:prolyl oligopeptidase family serine peptidase [Gemmataceae bacterium]
MIRHLFSVAALIAIAATAGAADTGFIDKTYKDASGTEHKYVLFVPHNYSKEKSTPTILFLHGAGETKQKEGAKTKGTPKMPVEVGIGPAIKKREKSFPFLTIIPQAPVGGWQAGGVSAKMALGILEAVEKEYNIDLKRIYLTGLSMGGYGTWSLAAAMPDKWAAIVPICGGVRGTPADEVAAKIKDIPTWVFHGDQDPAVPVAQSRNMVEALKKAGGNPKYTEYAGVKHDSWVPAYDTDELYEWMLKQSKK